MRTASWLWLAMCLVLCNRCEAGQMFRFDLQSLAYMSSAAIEGDVIADETIHWVDKLSVKITRVYAGEIKQGDTITVGLSAFSKVGKDAFDWGRFGKGDHLILFIEPVTQQSWKEDGIPYWPVASGLVLISDEHATGVSQQRNPGPYVNDINEGNADKFREKVADAVKWSVAFKQQLDKKRPDVEWLLKQLKARPEIKPDAWGVRDEIAVILCGAIAETGDKAAIEKARTIRIDYFERQILDLPANPGPSDAR